MTIWRRGVLPGATATVVMDLVTSTQTVFNPTVALSGPTTYISDTFTRANGSIGTAETGGTYGFVGSTTFNIFSNAAYMNSVNGTGTDIAWLDPGVSDITISADIAYLTATSVGLMTRVTPHTGSGDVNLVGVLVGSGVLSLYRCTNSTYTQVGSNGGSLTNGNTYNVKMIVSGNTHNVYLNGSLVIGPQTITQHAGVTKVALLSFGDTATKFDNFLVTS